jgi:hypothetical protein
MAILLAMFPQFSIRNPVRRGAPARAVRAGFHAENIPEDSGREQGGKRFAFFSPQFTGAFE